MVCDDHTVLVKFHKLAVLDQASNSRCCFAPQGTDLIYIRSPTSLQPQGDVDLLQKA